MSQKFDELFDGYPEGMDEMRKQVHLAIHNSYQEMRCVAEDLEKLTAPTDEDQIYSYVGAINHLEIWQVKGAPMALYRTFHELNTPLTEAFEAHCAATEKREGWLRRKHKTTPEEWLVLRNAALKSAKALEEWLLSIHPAPPKQQ